MTAVLISQEQIPTSITGAVAYRVHYNSADVQGKPTTSSGLVITPSTPGENRKVMTWSHGTTGLGDAGCPSAQPDPAREITTYFESGSLAQIDYGIPGLQKFIDDGWIVTATDYQGLGTEGTHHWASRSLKKTGTPACSPPQRHSRTCFQAPRSCHGSE